MREDTRTSNKAEKNKRENRAALKKFIPMLIVCAVIGGITGGVSSFIGYSDFSGSIAEAALLIVNMMSPWAVIILGVSSFIACWAIYRKARAMYQEALAAAEADGESGEPDEQIFEEVEDKLSQGMFILSVIMIVQMLFFGIMMADLENIAVHSFAITMVATGVFVAGNLAQLKQQQLMVDLEKEMNPSKRGSVYDAKFRDKWEESCDELEKIIIYKSAYKAYKTTALTCVILWIVMATLSIAFKTGPLPSIAVTVIWLVQTVSYCREAMKLERGGKK
ncbi:MAG: DUF3169 family protein [Anaerovoracaceae bacterium]